MIKIESYDFVHTFVRRPLNVFCHVCGKKLFASSGKICTGCMTELPDAKGLINNCEDRLKYFKEVTVPNKTNEVST